MLLIQVTCGDKKIFESSMEYLQELGSSFGYGKELQKQSTVVAIKLREIKAPVYLRLESRAEVLAEEGILPGERFWKPVIGWRLRSW